MTKKTISDAVGNIRTRYIEEAAEYSVKGKRRKPVWTKLGAVAACLVLVCIVGGILVPVSGDDVAAYAYETNEEITAAGVVMDTGTIRSSGEMIGHPLMFYLSGKDIEAVRFSCKNQQINFIDWTEKRDEYGNAQNFTVTYGEDEKEYYYLTIDWVPNATIRELTDHREVSIADLPAEMREDMIVMEITFANGKTATKAITISLLDNGTFLAAFDDYKIGKEDTFIQRPDSEYIPRDILYSQGSEAINNKTEPTSEAINTKTEATSEAINSKTEATSEAINSKTEATSEAINSKTEATSEAINSKTEATSEAINNIIEATSEAAENTIIFNGTIIENTIDTLAYVILVEPSGNEIPYDAVFFELSGQDADWVLQIGEKVTITCLDTFTDQAPHFGTLLSITEQVVHEGY